LKIVKDDKLFDAKKLLDKGLIILSRDNDNVIVPFKDHFDKVSTEEIYFRCGQLNSENKINGLGRKIRLTPKYTDEYIVDFHEETTYLIEG